MLQYLTNSSFAHFSFLVYFINRVDSFFYPVPIKKKKNQILVVQHFFSLVILIRILGFVFVLSFINLLGSLYCVSSMSSKLIYSNLNYYYLSIYIPSLLSLFLLSCPHLFSLNSILFIQFSYFWYLFYLVCCFRWTYLFVSLQLFISILC